MDQKLLLNEALSFLHLTESSTEQDLKTTYHQLAKKYHPDSGEFDSDILFHELQKHHEFLKSYLSDHGSFRFKSKEIPGHKKKEPKKEGSDPIFNLYKLAKEEETKAILDYFERTKNTPLHLDELKNKNLIELRFKLEPVRKKYQEIVSEHPESIWAKDSKDSLQRISVWWR